MHYQLLTDCSNVIVESAVDTVCEL